MMFTKRQAIATFAAIALFVPLSAVAAFAGDFGLDGGFASQRTKVGASGRVYTWQPGHC